jgi:putative transcriptional regulator
MMDRMSEEPSLAPALLLSMPQMNDPNFERTVVLLCQHNAEGAFGLVINRPITTLAQVSTSDKPGESSEHELEVWVGGPVEPERSWILTADASGDDGAVAVSDGVFLSTSPVVLQRIIDGGADDRTRLVAGYAGWGPGQLDAELAASAWLSLDVQLDIVFDTPAESMWEAAIRRLGTTPGGLQTGQGVH